MVAPDPVTRLTPASPAEVASAVRECSHNGTPVIPVGGRTKQHIGRRIDFDTAELSLRTLDQVHHYDPGDLTIGVGAGITLAKLQQVLAEHKQCLPLDPMLPETATIGGILATNAHGPMKAAFGGVRDLCVGIEYATADGLIAKAGGKVVKNVAGYDLMKLLIGSYGTLGVITAANFKVYPQPAQTHTFLAHFENVEQLTGYLTRLRTSLGNSFLAMEAISPRAHEYLSEHVVRDPDDYSPSAPVRHVKHWTLAIRAHGRENVIARCRRELRTETIDELANDATYWLRLSDFEVSVQARHRNAMVLYVNAPLAELAQVFDAAEKVAPEFTMLHAGIGRATTGNLVVCFMPLAVDPPSAVAFANAASAFRARLSNSVSVIAARCPEESKLHFDVWGATPTDRAMMTAVKSAMDPKNILNRGRYIVG